MCYTTIVRYAWCTHQVLASRTTCEKARNREKKGFFGLMFSKKCKKSAVFQQRLEVCPTCQADSRVQASEAAKRYQWAERGRERDSDDIPIGIMFELGQQNLDMMGYGQGPLEHLEPAHSRGSKSWRDPRCVKEKPLPPAPRPAPLLVPPSGPLATRRPLPQQAPRPGNQRQHQSMSNVQPNTSSPPGERGGSLRRSNASATRGDSRSQLLKPWNNSASNHGKGRPEPSQQLAQKAPSSSTDRWATGAPRNYRVPEIQEVRSERLRIETRFETKPHSVGLDEESPVSPLSSGPLSPWSRSPSPELLRPVRYNQDPVHPVQRHHNLQPIQNLHHITSNLGREIDKVEAMYRTQAR